MHINIQCNAYALECFLESLEQNRNLNSLVVLLLHVNLSNQEIDFIIYNFFFDQHQSLKNINDDRQFDLQTFSRNVSFW